METKRNRSTLYRPKPRANKDGPNYAPATTKSRNELAHAIQGHKGRGDGEQDDSASDKPLTALTASGISLRGGCLDGGGVVHRLRSTPLGMRRAIDIFLPRLLPDNPVPDALASTPTSTRQLAKAPSVSDFGWHDLEHSDYKSAARRTIERVRRLNLSFNRARKHIDMTTSSPSNGTFRDIVGHAQQK